MRVFRGGTIAVEEMREGLRANVGILSGVLWWGWVNVGVGGGCLREEVGLLAPVPLPS